MDAFGAIIGGVTLALPSLDRLPGSDSQADAVETLAASVDTVLSGGSLDEALARIVDAVAAALDAGLVIARVAPLGTDELVARAVYARSAVVAAELQGSKLRTEEVGRDELDYDAAADGTAPRAVRRAAARAEARVGSLFPVLDGGAAAATLEVYRDGPPLTPREQALGRLSAGHVAAVLELSRTIAGGETPGERARASLEALGEALAAGSDETEAAEQVVRLAAEVTGADRCLVWRIEADTPPALLAAARVPPGPDALEASADAVRSAIEQRGAAAGGDAVAAEDGSFVLPLGEPPAGALQLAFSDPAVELDADVLSAFAARAAVALRRTRRAQLVALGLRRSQTVVAVVSQAIAHLSLSHTLETAVDRISELTTSAHVAVYLREGERLTAAAERGLAGSHSSLAERLLELALGPFRSRGFLFIADMTRDPRLAGLDGVLAETGVRRALVVPLVVHDEVIGALAVFKQRPRPYRAGEEGLLIALSSQLAVAVENARLHERTKELGRVLERTLASERRAARQLRGLFEISHSFARSLSLEATLDAVAKTTVELFGVDAAAIRMPDGRGTSLEARAVHVAEPALREAAATILSRPQALTEPPVARVLASREPVVLADPAAGAEADAVLEPFLRKGSTAAVLPLATPGEVIGTLTLLSLDPTRPLDPETVETAMTVTRQAAFAIDNARLYQQQKDFAETMQRSLLPSELPAVPGVEVGHVYQSSSRVDVGGDVYDFLTLDDGRLAVCLGDVTGKGIQAAADMAMAKFAFRALARSYPEPSDFLARVNEVVIEEISLGKFITMLYAVVDPRAREVACANAGHPCARLVLTDGTVSVLPAPGLALGVESDQEYGTERSILPPGSSVVLFTDGVTESRRNGELYGEGRLDAFLREHAGLPAQDLAHAVLGDCQTFAGGDVPDDCAVVCLRMSRR